MAKQPKNKQQKSDYIDITKQYGIPQFTEEYVNKAMELNKKYPGSKFVCTANGCADIASQAANAMGHNFGKANAWEYGNRSNVLFTNPAYSQELQNVTGPLHDPTSYDVPKQFLGMENVLVGLNRKNNLLDAEGNKVGNIPNAQQVGAAANRSQANDSLDYANQELYKGSRGYEHVGYMMGNNTLLHGTGASKDHPAFFVLDDISNGIDLSGYGKYEPVEAIAEPTKMQAIASKVKSLGNRAAEAVFGEPTSTKSASLSIKKENGGWLEKYSDGGPVQENYNDYSVSAPEGFVGDGYSNVGRNYSPAWGGQFAMGGSMPGAVGFTYARTQSPAPSNGPYAKKTMASAQNGTEMEYYQNGLDWRPRSMDDGGDLYIGKDPKKFDKNVAKSDETKKSPAINYRSTADSERIAREKELARRQTSVSAYDQKGMSPEVRKSVGEAMENQRVHDERIRKFADAAQVLGAGLEIAAPFTGPAAPALGAVGAGLGAGSSAYLAGKDAMAGDYKSALTNAAFGGLDVAGFSAIRNMGLKNAVSAADEVADFGQVTDPSQLKDLNIFTGKAPKGSFSSLLSETKGRFNPKAKQSIEEGNQWLQDWVNHPATQQKIDDIFDSNFGLNTMSNLSREAYDKLKNYTPNAKAYPLKSQAKDFLDLRSKGYASKEGYPTMVHQGNRGVSYTHHRMPGSAPNHERFGNWISLSPDMNEIERASTAIHEGTHDWLRGSTLNVLGYDTDILRSLDPDVQRVVLQRRQLEQTGHSDEDIRKIMGENDYGITYYAHPAEVHARTMEIRNAFGIKPDQKITADDWEHIRWHGSKKANQISPFHFKMFDTNQSAADVMNRLLVAPAAVGVGAAAMANQPEMEQGGQLTKLDQLTNFTNYNTKQPGGWLDKYEG